jgi:hypothetical protein
VRRAAVAGSWYPGTTKAIVAEVEAYLERITTQPPSGQVVALISPHAGLRYSGPVAAYAHAMLRARADLSVVLVGPSHRFAFDGIALWPRGAFETPLGQTPIDEELAGALLAESEGIVDGRRPHLEEHSLEMQLPFLQVLCPGLQIVPALMGRQTRASVEALAAALAAVVPRSRRPVVLVASSDLSHYHAAPVANRLDALVIDDVARFDPERLMSRLEEEPEHACGGGPIVSVLSAARALGATHSAVLRYADSGDAGERDKSRVVGYLAAALLEPA